ncbi:hypothetical protein C8F01DRAFT_1146663, partial [Mycena amicta]
MESQVQLRTAEWSQEGMRKSPSIKPRRSARSIPKKMVEYCENSDKEDDVPLDELEAELHPEVRQIELEQQRASEKTPLQQSTTIKPRIKQELCPLCDAVIPLKRTEELDRLLLQLEHLPEHSPAVPALERAVCLEVERIADYDGGVLLAVQRGWPLKIDLNTIPPQVFALRNNLCKLLTDERLLKKNPVLQSLATDVDYKISEFENIYASGANHKLRQATSRYRRAAYYGPHGYAVIQASLHTLVSLALPNEQIVLTLASVAELSPQWKLDDDSTLFSEATFIAHVLTPFVAMLFIQQDRKVDFPTAMQTFADATVCFNSISTWPDDDEHSRIIKISQEAINELFQQALDEEEKNRKPAKPAEVIDIDAKVDSKAQKRKRTAVPKQEVVEQEEEEREPPRKKNKTSGKENQLEESKKTIHKMTVDDFPALSAGHQAPAQEEGEGPQIACEIFSLLRHANAQCEEAI